MILLAAVLGGAAVLVLLAVPSAGRLRLADVASEGARGVAGAQVRAPALRLGLLGLPVLAPLVAVGALVVGGPVPAALALPAVLVAGRVRAARRRATAAAAERAGALHACGVLSGELAAGRTPAEALAAAADVSVGSVAGALRAGASAARLGGDVPAALTGPAERSAAAGVLLSLAACWSVCARSGGGLSAAVHRLEEGLRAEAAQRRRVDAELAGPRATAALLAVLPGGGLLLAAGAGADPLHVLLETPVGLVCLVVGLGLDGLGLLWTDRLVRRVRPP